MRRIPENDAIAMANNTTLLTDKEYADAVAAVQDHLSAETSITKRQLRALTGLGYDQAIRAFNRMVDDGVVKRVGTGGGTRYIPRADP